MKRDDDEPGAGAKTPRGRLQKPVEAFELAVHPDAQGLKRARGRIDPRVAAPRDRPSHDRREPARRVDGRVTPRVDEGARDPARESLLAVGKNRVGELALRRAGDQIGGRVAPASVHAHVERFVALKTEPTAGPIELQRRHAEIGQRAVDERHSAIVENGLDRAVIGVNELDAIAPVRERFLASASASSSRSRPMMRVAPPSRSARE